MADENRRLVSSVQGSERPRSAKDAGEADDIEDQPWRRQSAMIEGDNLW
jgi:hypothetical protein